MKRLALGLCVILFSNLPAYSIKIVFSTVGDQWRWSEAVLMGTVASVRRIDGPIEAYRYLHDHWTFSEARVSVQEVFKGKVRDAEITVFFVHDPEKKGYYTQLESDKMYVFFLDSTNGGFSFGRPQSGAYPVVSHPAREPESLGLDRLRRTFEDNLDSADELVVLYSLKSLFCIGNEESLEKVRKVLDSQNELLRSGAQAILIKHGEWKWVKDVVRFLRARMSQPDPFYGFGTVEFSEINLIIQESLTMVRDPMAEPLILELIERDDPYNSIALMKSLEHIGTVDSSDLLLNLMRSGAKNVSYRAFRALTKICGVSYTISEKFYRNKDEIIQSLEKAVQEKKSKELEK